MPTAPVLRRQGVQVVAMVMSETFLNIILASSVISFGDGLGRQADLLECIRMSGGNDPPVCVIGAGITGLVIAQTLQDRGMDVVIYEKDFDHVGGKIDSIKTWGAVWERGPALFTQNDTYLKKFLARFDVDPISWYEGNVGIFNPIDKWANAFGEGYIPKFRDQWAALKKRYKSVWKKYPEHLFGPGGFQSVHKLYHNPSFTDIFLSGDDWLKSHGFDDLRWIWDIFFCSTGYGTISELPALYMLKRMTPEFADSLVHLITGSRNTPSRFFAPENGLAELAYKMVRNISCKYIGRNVINIHRTNTEHEYIVIQSNVDLSKLYFTRHCSKVVVAFTPLIGDMVRILPSITKEEKLLLSDIKVHKYFSSGHLINGDIRMDIKDFNVYLGVRSNEVLGDGRPVALMRSKRLGNEDAYTVYSWLYGNYASLPTDEDFGVVDDNMRLFIRNLTRDTPKLSFHDGFAHFPHVRQVDIDGAWFYDFSQLQGKNDTYYATTATTFDSVDSAIENAEYIADLVWRDCQRKQEKKQIPKGL